MRYRINREDFFAREEEQGTMAIMVCKTNQILHFNRAGRHIFDVCDRWVELDEFLHDLGAVNTTPAKLRRYFEEILYKLHACGLARLEEIPQPAGLLCRTRYGIGRKLQKIVGKGFGKAIRFGSVHRDRCVL